MGKVFKPEDFLKGRRRTIEEATSDLTPALRESAIRILESWKDKESEEELTRLLGNRESKRLMEKVK